MFYVIIKHNGDTVKLHCKTMQEARMVRASFIHWGGLGYDITIE